MLWLALGAVVFVLWGALRVWRIAGVGTAYKAKVLCSAVFVSGFDLDPDRADEVSAEVYGPMRLFRAKIDRESRSVTASFFGLRRRTAVYRPGLGATLALGDGWRPGTAGLPMSPPDESGKPWTAAPTVALGRIAQSAFGEPDPAKRRRTRAIVVVKDGKIVAETYAPGIGPAAPLAGWSMAKSVLGALVGRAILEGKLSLADRDLAPEWSGDRRAEISLEDLLRMRSGLAWTEVYSDPLSDVVRMLFARPDAGAYAASKALEADPGAAWKYSSGTTNIVSRVLRRALGELDYLAFPRSALFEPLAMTTAVFEPDASGTFVGSSFLLASARDWARFGQLHLQDGVWNGRRLLPEGWVRWATTPTPQSKDKRFGAHWWLRVPPELGGDTAAGRNLPADAFHALGHEGQCLTVIPSRGLVVVRLGLSIRIDAWDHAAFLRDVLGAV